MEFPCSGLLLLPLLAVLSAWSENSLEVEGMYNSVFTLVIADLSFSL